MLVKLKTQNQEETSPILGFQFHWPTSLYYLILFYPLDSGRFSLEACGILHQTLQNIGDRPNSKDRCSFTSVTWARCHINWC